MYDELYQLEEELKKVESCKLEYLPEYGYSSKEENYSAYQGRHIRC